MSLRAQDREEVLTGITVLAHWYIDMIHVGFTSSGELNNAPSLPKRYSHPNC
jgi:hypothetical protein